MSQPVQLRLGFTSPVAPCTMRLSLAGGQVSVGVDHDQLSRAWAYLASVGIAAEASGATLVFAASALPALALLPGQVVTVPAENLATLPRAHHVSLRSGTPGGADHLGRGPVVDVVGRWGVRALRAVPDVGRRSAVHHRAGIRGHRRGVCRGTRRLHAAGPGRPCEGQPGTGSSRFPPPARRCSSRPRCLACSASTTRTTGWPWPLRRRWTRPPA